MTWRRGLHGFFVFLCEHGALAQSPMQLPRHQILLPTQLPRPMAEAEVVWFDRIRGPTSALVCGPASG